MATNSTSNLVSALAVASAGVGVLAAVALAALQSDMASRRLMNPDGLQAKRHGEYIYRWNQALEKAKMQFKFFFAGMAVDEHADEEELIYTTFVESKEELDELVIKILSKKEKPVRIGRIGTDDKRKDSKEIYLWLYQGAGTIYQVPLKTFGKMLADAFDRKLCKTTFCFVSDASAGLGSQLVVDLVQATKTTDVCVVQEPLWMIYVAVIVHQKTINCCVMKRILFALCRLEALRATKANNESTVLMRVPGQSLTSILLHMLQKVFPDDRHVFSYTGCVKTVEYALAQRKTYPRARIPTSMDEALRFTNPIAYTTPLDLGLHKSANVMKPYTKAMASLPLAHADIVEAWMGSCDAFLNLKANEKLNGYVPYVFKMDYLVSDLGSSLEPKSDRYWTLLSVLQYVMGSKSRKIPSEQIDAAVSWLKDYKPVSTPTVSAAERKAISNVVFQHKLILIESKTFTDTVKPAEHWTLRGAVKAGGCSCCAPEDEDENENNDTFTTNTTTTTMMGAKPSKLEVFGRKPPKRTVPKAGFVDGKTMFAFDPTRFTGLK